MRGRDKVAHEWALVCLTRNMLKLARAKGRSLSAAELATAWTPPNRPNHPNPCPDPVTPSKSK
jgi:hypothetical protein